MLTHADEVGSGKTQAVRIRPGLSLYKQPLGNGRGSPNWYARAYLDVGGRKLHARSTGTTDLRLARKRAEEFLGDLLVKQRIGSAALPSRRSDPAKYRFDKVADQWLDHLEKHQRGDARKARSRRDHLQLIKARNGLGGFFKRTDIRSITRAAIEEYLAFADANGRNGRLRPTTLKKHLSTLRGVLGFAHDRGMIPMIPKMPTLRQSDCPRSWFTPAEYRQLRGCCCRLEHLAQNAGDDGAAAKWREMGDFVIFMINSFLRSSEWAGLKQKDIQVVDGEHPHLKISLLTGKTGARVVITMPGAIAAFRRMIQRHGVDPESYLCLPWYQNRTTARDWMRKAFEALLEETGLTYDSFGKKRVIHSLRHSALSFRLLQGNDVDRMMLAKNAGTSLAMLERFYCTDLGPEMKIANLQSFRRG